MLLESFGLHQCQGNSVQPFRSRSRVHLEGASATVQQAAKHPKIWRPVWSPNPKPGESFVKKTTPMPERMQQHRKTMALVKPEGSTYARASMQVTGRWRKQRRSFRCWPLIEYLLSHLAILAMGSM